MLFKESPREDSLYITLWAFSVAAFKVVTNKGIDCYISKKKITFFYSPKVLSPPIPPR